MHVYISQGQNLKKQLALANHFFNMPIQLWIQLFYYQALPITEI